jgi:tryptophan halogenase
MPKKRIAVVGKGTAGSQAIIHFARFFPDADITWYFDPKTPVQSVGEGSTLALPNNLFNNIGFTNEDLKKVSGTFKGGIYKENWGKAGNSFMHSFPPPSVGYHFNAVELQDYIYDIMKSRVKIFEGNVNYRDLTEDFIFNASGKRDMPQDFHESEYIPVNAAYITQCYWEYPRFDYTLTIAGKYGWVFGIPLQNRCSIGYIYNKNINTEQEVMEDVKWIFEKYNLTPSTTTNSLTFNNYFRKENYQQKGSWVHSGNASFFLEPLEATSVYTMDTIQRAAVDVWSGRKSSILANQEYTTTMRQIELMIMMHYASGSKFDTEFWSFAQERGIKRLEQASKDEHLKEICRSIKNIKSMNFAPRIESIRDYGSWWAGSFFQNINGLGLNKTMNDLFKI